MRNTDRGRVPPERIHRPPAKRDWSLYFDRKRKKDRTNRREYASLSAEDEFDPEYGYMPTIDPSVSSEYARMSFSANHRMQPQPNREPSPKSAFPSLQDALNHNNIDIEPIGLGLNLSHEYIDHFSCTTLTRLIIGCVLCAIIALVISILVVAFST